jgi:hypothetical protein
MTALRRTLLVFGATAALAVCAIAVASAVTHDDDSPSPQHTVRDFLLAAVSRHDGFDACRYVSQLTLVQVHAIEPRGMSCEAAISSSAHLTLGGRRITTEAQVKSLTYRAEAEPDGRERVTVSWRGASRSFVLRRATRSELVELGAPPTPWRIDSGVPELLTR